MKKYIYEEPGGERGEIFNVETKTEEEILDEYWDFWKELMEKKYGPNHELITDEHCIADWCTIHGAWEDKEESGS